MLHKLYSQTAEAYNESNTARRFKRPEFRTTTFSTY